MSVARLAAALLALALGACATLPPPPAHPPRAVPLAPAPKSEQPVIAFVLGGGGARGFAHIGALKVLDEAGVRADLVVGASAGSIIGALYAGGIRNDALVQAALAVQREEVLDFVFPNRGFIDGERLQEYVNRELHGRLIEELDMPLLVVATDLASGERVVFNRGDAGMAVRASCSVPAVFQPTPIEGREYVDGGLTGPVPVKVARQMGADVVIAIDVSRHPDERRDLGSTAALLTQTVLIMERALAREEEKLADVVVRPDLEKISASDLAARSEVIRAGEEAARAALAEVRRAIATATPVAAPAR
ncbi:MAG: patatin-like phospholipase family protein [Betaproteobacteria bacterium]|nr:patatin-like phospholipase family protein [Betaproteobacteria bacterium]